MFLDLDDSDIEVGVDATDTELFQEHTYCSCLVF